MVSAPFFNKESGQSASIRAEQLEIELEALRWFNREYKEKIQKSEVSNLELREMLEQTKIQKFDIEAEFKKLKDRISDSG